MLVFVGYCTWLKYDARLRAYAAAHKLDHAVFQGEAASAEIGTYAWEVVGQVEGDSCLARRIIQGPLELKPSAGTGAD